MTSRVLIFLAAFSTLSVFGGPIDVKRSQVLDYVDKFVGNEETKNSVNNMETWELRGVLLDFNPDKDQRRIRENDFLPNYVISGYRPKRVGSRETEEGQIKGSFKNTEFYGPRGDVLFDLLPNNLKNFVTDFSPTLPTLPVQGRRINILSVKEAIMKGMVEIFKGQRGDPLIDLVIAHVEKKESGQDLKCGNARIVIKVKVKSKPNQDIVKVDSLVAAQGDKYCRFFRAPARSGRKSNRKVVARSPSKGKTKRTTKKDNSPPKIPERFKFPKKVKTKRRRPIRSVSKKNASRIRKDRTKPRLKPSKDQ